MGCGSSDSKKCQAAGPFLVKQPSQSEAHDESVHRCGAGFHFRTCGRRVWFSEISVLVDVCAGRYLQGCVLGFHPAAHILILSIKVPVMLPVAARTYHAEQLADLNRY
jgi:hypothetical protein